MTKLKQSLLLLLLQFNYYMAVNFNQPTVDAPQKWGQKGRMPLGLWYIICVNKKRKETGQYLMLNSC